MCDADVASKGAKLHYCQLNVCVSRSYRNALWITFVGCILLQPIQDRHGLTLYFQYWANCCVALLT